MKDYAIDTMFFVRVDLHFKILNTQSSFYTICDKSHLVNGDNVLASTAGQADGGITGTVLFCLFQKISFAFFESRLWRDRTQKGT